MMRPRGFTLLELVLVLIILGVIGVAAARFLGGAVEAIFVTRELTDTQMESGAALDRMARDLRGAGSVDDCAGGSLILNGGGLEYAPADGRLELNDVLLAGTPEDPVVSFVCADTGVSGLYRLELETESGYIAQTHTYHRQ
ncbi:prepilin-type N-terminal cleavage/methylation domain-containing protein [Thioalkalivibrio sp. ALE19]|uniref:prepilin-type N-terminal cleavage/methylation domain-containing protein n=1 Tax=Thioalkalivibrio sp. ALE19 TaxID=1266909 RepID=UPI000422C4CE|nr:prepilin-type N-terminal cleavage/methylation domain-containing protein [Thioalkalivibrio sp. ALE19]